MSLELIEFASAARNRWILKPRGAYLDAGTRDELIEEISGKFWMDEDEVIEALDLNGAGRHVVERGQALLCTVKNDVTGLRDALQGQSANWLNAIRDKALRRPLLTLAAELGHAEVVTTLLEAGANPLLFDSEEDNALSAAIMAVEEESALTIIRHLLSHGADPLDCESDSSHSAFTVAARFGFDRAVEVFLERCEIPLVNINEARADAGELATLDSGARERVVTLLDDWVKARANETRLMSVSPTESGSSSAMKDSL